MRPIQAILVLEDLANSLQGPLYRKGAELSFRDTQTVKEVYIQWICLLLDLGYLHHDELKARATRLLTDMVKRDVLDLNNSFAELLSRVRLRITRGFKALCGEISSHLYHLIRDDVERLTSSDVLSAKRLIQLFSYTGRLSLQDIDLTQQCLEDYLATEERLAHPIDSAFLPDLNNTIKNWVRSFDTGLIKFRHGPGGVSGHGRTSLETKYLDLASDCLTDYAFRDTYLKQSPIPSNLDRISQTIFVPKSYKTFRTISMEPATLMYLQQGVWHAIDQMVGCSWYLRSHIGFHEQQRNQLLAKEGSFNRNYATIDLSAASDSVSYALVKEVFSSTKLLRYLVATRSKRTLLPDGRIVDLKKFAPMGSALCFPIETLIFAAICENVTREYGVTGDYSVFGDDIIVPTQCAERLMDVLNRLGFSVNKTKSYYSSECWFRESCGAEYCDGYDVTPMRVSRKYTAIYDDVRMSGLIDLANGAYVRGFRNLRSFFIKKLKSEGFVPLFGEGGILSENNTNYHTKRRINRDLQRDEALVTSFAPSSRRKTVDESIRLRHWLESVQDRDHLELAFSSRIDRPPVLKRSRWSEYRIT